MTWGRRGVDTREFCEVTHLHCQLDDLEPLRIYTLGAVTGLSRADYPRQGFLSGAVIRSADITMHRRQSLTRFSVKGAAHGCNQNQAAGAGAGGSGETQI